MVTAKWQTTCNIEQKLFILNDSIIIYNTGTKSRQYENVDTTKKRRTQACVQIFQTLRAYKSRPRIMRYISSERRLLRRTVCSAVYGLIYTNTALSSIEFFDEVLSRLRGHRAPLSYQPHLFYFIFSLKLPFGRFVWVHLRVYRSSDAYHTSLPYTADYGNLAATRNCNEMTLSPDEFLRRQELELLFLNRTVTWLRHFEDACNHFRSFENHTIPRWSISH